MALLDLGVVNFDAVVPVGWVAREAAVLVPIPRGLKIAARRYARTD
jgi:hypothetical protein